VTAVDQYVALADAWLAQQARRRGAAGGDRWGGETARRFRRDPRRTGLEAGVRAVAGYLAPDDVLLDVGGGAGRMSLPLALRCREVVNVDPSPGMGQEFQESAAEAGITNVRFMLGAWTEAPELSGDIALAAHVTYFVRDIEGFIRKLQRAARRRVIFYVRSVPPPNSNPSLYALLNGEPQALVPGHRELLPALWDLGILPDVVVIPGYSETTAQPTGERERVLAQAARPPGGDPAEEARRRALIDAHFDELFVAVDGAYAPRDSAGAQDMLITWATP